MGPGVRWARAVAAGRLRPGTLAVLVAAMLSACAAPPEARAQAVRYVARLANINRVGLTVTNYGFLGNNFTSRSASFEYPLGTGFEHMSRAGLWVGGIALSDEGAFTGVTTALVDAAQGGASADETEFTPLGDAVSERSRLVNSRVYSPDAISDQDLISSYTDAVPRGASGNQRERHQPLDITVRQVTLGFTLHTADAFVVTRFIVTNNGPPIRDMWLGLYAQLASGDKKRYTQWPPTGSSGPGSWYYKAHIEYDAARRLYAERYCVAPPYPAGCASSLVPPWAGVKLLGVSPGGLADKQVNWRWWSFEPGDATKDEDVERYQMMSETRVDDPAGCLLLGQCSPIQLLSVGPFPFVAHGESLSVDVAFVGGLDATFLDNADYAQFAYDLDYRLPSPPPSPRVQLVAGRRSLDVWWDDSPEHASDPTSPAPGGLDFEGYRIYLGLDQQDPTRVVQFDVRDTTGFNSGLEPALAESPLVVDGVTYRYRYRIEGLKDGFRYWGAVTSYDTGDRTIESLESGITQNKFLVVPSANAAEQSGVYVFPNPYHVEATWDAGLPPRDKVVWFGGLPERCTVRIYSLAGDIVMQHEFDGSVYQTENVRGIWTPERNPDTGAPALSGTTFAWDLISDRGQAIATGLYMWTVEDRSNGHVQRGKLLVVKSDREP